MALAAATHIRFLPDFGYGYTPGLRWLIGSATLNGYIISPEKDVGKSHNITLNSDKLKS